MKTLTNTRIINWLATFLCIAAVGMSEEIITDGDFDDLSVGSAPDNGIRNGAWRVASKVGESGEHSITVVETASFDPGATGNSLSLSRPVVLNQRSGVENQFNRTIHENKDEIVRATFRLFIPSTATPGQPTAAFFIGGNHGDLTFPTSGRDDRGPQLEWHRDGSFVASECNLTADCGTFDYRTIVKETPLDQWQRIQLDIDLSSDFYDLFWSAESDVPELIARFVRFRSGEQDHLDRFTAAFFSGLNDHQFPEGNVYFDDLQIEVLTKLPGDADLDGDVDFGDFLALSNNFGSSGTWSQGDFNEDRRVEFNDFLLLSDNFGDNAAVAVPEPGASNIALLSLAALCRLRKQRTHRVRCRGICAESLEDRQLLTSGGFTQREIIVADGKAPVAVAAADIDGDDDIDIALALSDGNFSWYSNDDALGKFGEPDLISEGDETVVQILAIDVDNDGDLDLVALGASYTAQLKYEAPSFGDEISWFENLDGTGTFGARQSLPMEGEYVRSIIAVEVDGDDNADVLALVRTREGFAVDWYESAENGFTAPQRILGRDYESHIVAVHIADMDGDGDSDAVVSVVDPDRNMFPSWDPLIGNVAWFENIDGKGTFGVKTTSKVRTESLIKSIDTADVDGDGDLDVLTASFSGGSCQASGPPSCDFRGIQLAWHENTDGQGKLAAPRLLETLPDPLGPASIFYRVSAVDVDNDGDADVVSSRSIDDGFSGDDKIVWYENTDGQGTFSDAHLITNETDGLVSVFVTDIDRDGDADVLSASWYDGKLAWYESEAVDPAQLIPGDADGDGKVAFADFLILSANFGKQADAVWADGDFNEDGRVSFDDFLILSVNFRRDSANAEHRKL